MTMKIETEIKKNEAMTDDTLNVAIQALEELKKERELRAAAEKQLEAQAGKVLFADSVTASKDSILVAEMAVMLQQSGVEIGRDRLFEWLRGKGYAYRLNCGRNIPSRRSLELGVMELKKQTVVNAYGKASVTATLKITAKGQQYFMEQVMLDKEAINARAAEKKAEQAQQRRQRQQEKQQGA